VLRINGDPGDRASAGTSSNDYNEVVADPKGL
jgi:hypothetical protein